MWSESFPALPRAPARSRFRRELTRALNLACWRLRRRRLVRAWSRIGSPYRAFAAGRGRMLVAEPMAVEPGCDIVRRARELAAAGEVTALVDAAALGFADSDSERILAGSRGEIRRGAIGARLWVDGPAPGDVMCPLGMSGRSKEGIRLARRGSHSRFRERRRAMVRTAPGVPWCGSPEFARTSVLGARPQRAWHICFVWSMRNSVPRQLFCATLTVFPR